MVVGMLSQIVCGNLTGIIKIYEFHVCFRWLSACTCALMYTSGQMICKSVRRTYLFTAFSFISKDQFNSRRISLFVIRIIFLRITNKEICPDISFSMKCIAKSRILVIISVNMTILRKNKENCRKELCHGPFVSLVHNFIRFDLHYIFTMEFRMIFSP